MKTAFICLAVSLFFSLAISAQSDNYLEELEKEIERMELELKESKGKVLPADYRRDSLLLEGKKEELEKKKQFEIERVIPIEDGNAHLLKLATEVLRINEDFRTDFLKEELKDRVLRITRRIQIEDKIVNSTLFTGLHHNNQKIETVMHIPMGSFLKKEDQRKLVNNTKLTFEGMVSDINWDPDNLNIEFRMQDVIVR